MAKVIVHLVFPQKLIKEPLIFQMAKKYDVTPNIRRANITDKVGEVTLLLSGTRENLEKGRKFLERKGIKVDPVVGDIVAG